MGVEYDGSGMRGWQRQHDEPTVQRALEEALGSVANHPVTVHGAGRTDAGVHARAQVFHFDTRARRKMHNWVLGGNSRLPDTVALLWARPVPDDFHARYSARSRHYRYLIVNRRSRPALGRTHYAWFHRPLDERRMQAAARALVGEHDFTSFRAVACQAAHAVRRVHAIEVRRREAVVRLDITANAYLHHMVRNIAGSLMAVGCGDREPEWIGEVLAARDRRRAGVTAPAAGLSLVSVDYAPAFGLPVGVGEAFPPYGR